MTHHRLPPDLVGISQYLPHETHGFKMAPGSHQDRCMLSLLCSCCREAWHLHNIRPALDLQCADSYVDMPLSIPNFQRKHRVLSTMNDNEESDLTWSICQLTVSAGQDLKGLFCWCQAWEAAMLSIENQLSRSHMSSWYLQQELGLSAHFQRANMSRGHHLKLRSSNVRPPEITLSKTSVSFQPSLP